MPLEEALRRLAETGGPVIVQGPDGKPVAALVPIEKAAGSGSAESRPIEDVLAALAAQVPAEEWARVPADLNSSLDHYLYGKARR